MSDAFLTGAFGIAVALITWLLAGLRERNSFRRDMQKEHVRKLESIYAECVESLEMSMRITVSIGSYEQIEREHSKNNALLRLLSTNQINDQYEKVSVLMHQWSVLYRRGAPKPIGDLGVSMIASGDSEFSKKADELRPQLNDELVALIKVMAKHLSHERASA
ncbi:MAG: hypothetical protein NUV63_00230 [Gallionella sp.]|nr:hypothetical protein [Gallionella sp.]